MAVAVTEALADLKRPYVDGALERLATLAALVNRLAADGGGDDSRAAYSDLTRHVHSMKVSAGLYGFPALSAIARRLEAYLAAADKFSPQTLAAIPQFLQPIRAILDAGVNPNDTDLPDILDRLPAAGTPGAEREPMALLVMEKGAARDKTAAAIAGAGFKVSTVDRAVDAIKLIFIAPPDVIVSAADFPFLSGAELAQAVHAMKTTAWLPIVLLAPKNMAGTAADFPDSVHLIDAGADSVLAAHLSHIRACAG